jgi:aminoglycoside phosphotransferase (APT) family kinase protein
MADLKDALRARELRMVRRLPDGLSGTILYEARTAGGEPMLVKVIRSGPSVVDGHDEASFRRKPLQIAHLADQFPAVAALHVPIRDELAGPGWCAHVMPFVDGTDMLTPVDDAPARISTVIDQLARDGWVHRTERGMPYLRAAHLDRIRRRWAFLAAAVPPAALDSHGLEVNGAPCRGLRVLLDVADRMVDLLEPDWLAPPVHGDLNTRNVIFTGSGFVLVDPRGVLEPMDPCYDLGKITLSLSIWDPFVRDPGGLVTDGHGKSFHVRIPFLAGYRELLAALPAIFARSAVLLQTLGRRWQARLAFSHAVHAVAEAACRVSDIRAKGQPDAAAQQHASAFLLYGLVLLDDVVTRAAAPDDFDLAAHLALTRLFTRREVPDAVPVPCGRPLSGV